MFFICPKCKGQLNIENGTARCASGHSYDRSRYGYFNLLISEKGGVHGDNKDMVAARREFLSRGFYEPLAQRIASIAKELLKGGGVLLDAGCGEGYYTQRVSAVIAELPHTRVAAFDISKDAVRQAAKRLPGADLAVCGSYHMPVTSESVDVLLNTFSPLAVDETRRVIKSGGYFIMAIPAEEHLFGLKKKIYDTPYKNTVEDTFLEGFTLVDRVELKYPLLLECASDVRALFMMTPYAYRTSEEGRKRVLTLDCLECEAHFLILVYKKG